MINFDLHLLKKRGVDTSFLITSGKQMGNNMRCFNRIDFAVIPSYIKLSCSVEYTFHKFALCNGCISSNFQIFFIYIVHKHTYILSRCKIVDINQPMAIFLELHYTLFVNLSTLNKLKINKKNKISIGHSKVSARC